MLKSLFSKSIFPDETYLVSLKEKTEYSDKFLSLDLGIKLEEAVDSRVNKKIYEDYGLSLDPADETQIIYFSQSVGAVGCFLSHYKIWWKSLLNGNKWTLNLEDDANVSDVERFLTSKGCVMPADLDETKPQLIILNKRTKEQELPFWPDGTEAFLYNRQAAIAFLHHVYDSSFLSNAIREYFWFDAMPKLKPQFDPDGSYRNLIEEIIEENKNKDFSQKNVIRYAADKFLGHCSLPECPEEYRVNIHVVPMIGLSEFGLQSDVFSKDIIKHWDMSEQDYIDFKKSEDWKWWEK